MEWPLALVACVAILAVAWLITCLIEVRDLNSIRNLERRLGRCEVRVNELEEDASEGHPPQLS